MGYIPTTHCNECGDPFDVYRAPDDRICDCCKEAAPVTRTCEECGGHGWVPGTDIQPDCCGRVHELGYCRGDCAVPVQVETQEECAACGGTGRTPDQRTSFPILTDKEAEDFKEMQRIDRASVYAT